MKALLIILALAGRAAADPEIMVPPVVDTQMTIAPPAIDPDIVIGPVHGVLDHLADLIVHAVRWLVPAPT